MADRYWVGGTAAWDGTAGTKWSTSSGGGGGASVPTASDNVFFTSASTYTVTITGSYPGGPKCLNLTVSAGTVTFAGTGDLIVNGDFTLLAGTVWSHTGFIYFDGTASKTITSNGVVINASVYLGTTVSSTVLLADALTVNTTKTTTLNLGTLDINGKTLTTGRFSSSNSNVRTIAFGVGNIYVNATSPATTVFTLATSTNLTVTGTPVVNIKYSGTGGGVNPGQLPESQAPSLYFLSGISGLSIGSSASDSVKNLSFAASSVNYIPTITNGLIIYGDLTLNPTPSANGLNWGSTRFNGSSGTQTITTNGQTFGNTQVSVNGTSTVFLADAISFVATGSSGTITLNSGTFDGNNKTITLPSGGRLFIYTGVINVKNINTTFGIVHDLNALVTVTGNCSCGLYTLTNGDLNLNGYTVFATSLTTTTGTKSLTFNGGTLAITNATVTAFNNAVPAGFTTTAGTGTGKISMTAATAKTFVGGGSTYNCTVSNDGAGLLTITGNNAISTVTSTSGSIAITGNNTITTITNAVQPMTYTFTAGTTQTITNWLVGGTVGNLVTIASATAASHTLSKIGGIVSANYLSISRSTATGGAVWYAGANSTNGGNNSGWIFQNAPAGAAFFAIF
jgi:hypothetical protein